MKPAIRNGAAVLCTALILSACGKSGSGTKLPAACADALQSYAKLSSEKRQALDMSIRIGLEPMLEQGGGDAKKAVKAWQKSFADQYDALKKAQSKEAAQAASENTQALCKEWKAGLK